MLTYQNQHINRWLNFQIQILVDASNLDTILSAMYIFLVEYLSFHVKARSQSWFKHLLWKLSMLHVMWLLFKEHGCGISCQSLGFWVMLTSLFCHDRKSKVAKHMGFKHLSLKQSVEKEKKCHWTYRHLTYGCKHIYKIFISKDFHEACWKNGSWR